MGSLLELSKANQLQVHEKPKNLKLITEIRSKIQNSTEPFSVENGSQDGLLTPTMKLSFKPWGTTDVCNECEINVKLWCLISQLFAVCHCSAYSVTLYLIVYYTKYDVGF